MNELAELLRQILEEQRQTNQLLTAMLGVMVEDVEDEDVEPTSYLDGSPIQ